MSEELKPCPFCGNRVFLQRNTTASVPLFRVYCVNADCEVLTQWFPNKDAVIAIWNRRMVDDDILALVIEYMDKRSADIDAVRKMFREKYPGLFE